MNFIGSSEETTKWFKSCLPNRKFKAHIKNIFSEPGNLLWGVPQVSFLGPLLFLLYTNDMPQAAGCQLLLYAEGTCLIYQNKDITEIEMALTKISWREKRSKHL